LRTRYSTWSDIISQCLSKDAIVQTGPFIWQSESLFAPVLFVKVYHVCPLRIPSTLSPFLPQTNTHTMLHTHTHTHTHTQPHKHSRTHTTSTSAHTQTNANTDCRIVFGCNRFILPYPIDRNPALHLSPKKDDRKGSANDDQGMSHHLPLALPVLLLF
jgi:hypothetical protein